MNRMYLARSKGLPRYTLANAPIVPRPKTEVKSGLSWQWWLRDVGPVSQSDRPLPVSRFKLDGRHLW